MRIIELREENVKKIKALQIHPDPHMVVVEGKNAQGKTSLLDGILYTLAGGKTIPDQVVREGQESAIVSIDIGDYKITRKWTKLGTTLKIETKEGLTAPSPQTMLDSLIGHLAFDPMEFCTKDKKDRTTLLKKVAGLDFTDLEAKYKKAYDERTFVNRELEQADAILKTMPMVQDAPVIAISDIQQKRQAAEEHNRKRTTLIDYSVNLQSKYTKASQEIAEHRAAIDRLEEVLFKLEKEITEQKVIIDGMEVMDISAYDKAIAEHSRNVLQHEKFLQRSKAEAIRAEKAVKSSALSLTLQNILAEKEQRLAAANMPIPGLNFINGDVSFNGVEFGQISMGQKIQVSMAIAMALNPKLKIIRILNGSLLDNAAMEEIKKLAIEKDFQIWIERVADTKSGSAIYIEEGEVK